MSFFCTDRCEKSVILDVDVSVMSTFVCCMGLFGGSITFGKPDVVSNMVYVFKVYGTMKHHMSAIHRLYSGNGLLLRHPNIKYLMATVHTAGQ